MALQLNKELLNGTVGNYLSIVGINVSDTSSKVYLTLHLSKIAKDAGKVPMLELSKNVTHTKAEVMTGNVYAFMYGKVKESDIEDGVEQNELVNATDVLE